MTNNDNGSRKISMAVFDEGAVRVESVDLPPRSSGEIDLAMTASAICGSDLHTVLGHRNTARRTALGHEGVGRVSSADPDTVDDAGTQLELGDRVVFALFSACNSCDRCRAGLTMKCRELIKYGHESVATPPHATGTLATHIRLLPGVPILRVPDDVTDVDVVSAGCAVATAAAIIDRARPFDIDRPILVFGAGAVGVYCAAMLSSEGGEVWVRDPSEQRLEVVEEFGARRDDRTERDYPVAIEASGSPTAFVEAIDAVDLGGHVVAAGSVSAGSTTVTFDPATVVTRRLTISGIHNYTAKDFARGVDWLTTCGRHLDLGRLVSPPVQLSNVEEGFDQMHRGTHHRVLVLLDAALEGDS